MKSAVCNLPLGEYIEAEVQNAHGRADAVVKTDKYIYVFEFKLKEFVGDALRQIDDKGYLISYTVDSRKLMKVGVNFDAGKRNIGDCKVVE